MKKLKLLPLLFLLCLCACLLIGCGAGEEQETANESELVYTAAFQEIKAEEQEDLWPLCFTEDGFYVTRSDIVEKGEVPEGVTPEFEGQYDTFAQRLYFVSLDGAMQPLDFTVSQAPTDEDERKDYSAGSYLQGLYPAADGSLTALETVYESWYEGPEGLDQSNPGYWDHYKNQNAYWLYHLDQKGAVLSSARLEWEEQEGVWLNLQEAVLDKDDRLVAAGDQQIYVFSPDGALLREIEMDDWINQTILLSDGRVGAVTSGRRGGCVCVLDLDKGAVTEKMDLNNWPQRCYPGFGDYAFLYTSGTKLYAYAPAEKQEIELVNLLDCDLSAQSLNWLRGTEDGGFLAYCVDGQEIDRVELKQVERSSLPEKRTLTLGVMNTDSVSEQVMRFNRTHPSIRIQILDYSEYLSGDTMDAALDSVNKLNTQIMAGEMPDLLALENLPYEQLAGKGLLEDLYPYLDADPDFAREDFLPQVLKAAEIDGKLYQLSSGYRVSTMIGAASVVGTEPGWTIPELEQAFASMPEGCEILGPYSTRDMVLMELLFADMNSYVNWQQGTCDFDNADFCALLEFCGRFPAQVDYGADLGSEYGRVAQGKQMLMECSISSLEDLGYSDQYFGGTCTYIGFPVRSGSGSYLVLNNGFAMSASCSDKEAAWDFLRLFLRADYQRDQYGLPLRQDVFQEQLEDAMRIEYLRNEDGQYVLDENGQRIPQSRGGMGVADEGGGMFSFEYYGLTQEQADRFLALLDSASPMPGMNTKIFEIVNAEATPFFNGERSAEDTAKIIQNKVSLYISEQS